MDTSKTENQLGRLQTLNFHVAYQSTFQTANCFQVCYIYPIASPNVGNSKAIQASTSKIHEMVSLGLYSGTPLTHALPQQLSLVTEEIS